MATIISFANQKGGVGKTTLCITFANYLAEKGERILVHDCDNQKSIVEKRKSDEKKYPAGNFLYNVQSFDISNSTSVEPLMEKLKTLDGIVLIDTPGHLSQQGLIPIFASSDYIVCPYQYDSTTINSTIVFLRFFKELSQRVKSMSTRLLLLPNRYDKRIGKKSELELWNKTEAAFSKYGKILPRIDIKADMQRFNTLAFLDAQREIVRDTYNQLYDIVKSIKNE